MKLQQNHIIRTGRWPFLLMAARLDRTEPDLNEALPGDPRDTTTPSAMLKDLQALALGDARKPESRRLLTHWLVRSDTEHHVGRGNALADLPRHARDPSLGIAGGADQVIPKSNLGQPTAARLPQPACPHQFALCSLDWRCDCACG